LDSGFCRGSRPGGGPLFRSGRGRAGGGGAVRENSPHPYRGGNETPNALRGHRGTSTPKKILAWDGEKQRIPTKENQFIWVDATARWRIADLVKFYESVTSLDNAYGRLDDVIDSAVRTVISSNYLREAVRILTRSSRPRWWKPSKPATP
jgi:hypothetical protein